MLRYNGSTGNFTDVFASAGGLRGPTALTFGPDNNLYVASTLGDEVLRYNGMTGDFIDVFTVFTVLEPSAGALLGLSLLTLVRWRCFLGDQS